MLDRESMLGGVDRRRWRRAAALPLLALLAAAPVRAQVPSGSPPGQGPRAGGPVADAPARSDAESLYREGRDARLAGRIEDAIAKLGAAAVAEPDNADVQVQLGLSLAAGQRFDDAKRAFGDALRIAPGYDDAQLGLARTLFWNGELAAADQALAPLRGRGSPNPELGELDKQIAAARLEAAPATAEKPATAPTPQQPKPPPPRVKPARAEPVRLRPALSSAAALGTPAAALAEAQSFRRRGQFHAAEAAYRRALLLVPRDADILVNLGLVQAFQGETRFDEARASFTRALERDPKSLDARLGLARVDLYTNALDTAAAGVDAVLDVKPDYTDALSLRARIRLARADASGAQLDFEELIRRDPKDSDALVGLGDAQRAQYRDDEARAAFERAKALAPDSQDVAKRLELPTRPRWRIDFDGNVSQLTRNFASWREGAIHIGYIWDERTTIAVGAEADYRFRNVDMLFDARIDRRWSQAVASYLRAGVTPNADYRPTVLMETGGSVEIWKGYGLIGASQATLDLGISHYRNAGDVKSISPGMIQYLADGRIWITGKLIGTIATDGDHLFGYSIRVDAKVTEKLAAFVGYADAPDNSDGRTTPSKAVYGGLTYDFNDSFGIKTSVAREARSNSYTRTTYSFGLTQRF